MTGLGKSETFDKAVSEFATAYADQRELDHKALKKAASKGQVEVLIERE